MNDGKHSQEGVFKAEHAGATGSAPSGADAYSMVNDAANALRENARDVAGQQKALGADRLAELGHAVHGAARGLEGDMPHAARFVHAAADRLEAASSGLREHSVDDVIGMVQRFARAQPGVAFAGAVLAGFAVSRFLKSSSAARREPA